MRRSNTQKIGEVLKEYVEALKIKSQLNEAGAHRHWNELVGPAMARYTKKVYVHQGTLFVHLTSSVLRAELYQQQDKIINYMNRKMGAGKINKMVFR